jgi:uncharacterized protein (TIGR03435 family)
MRSSPSSSSACRALVNNMIPPMRVPLLVVGLAVASARLLAQTPAAPSFEVASIKRATGGRESMVAQPGGLLTVTNLPLRFVIRTALQLQDDQIQGGPAWISTERFDITARAAADTPLTQLPAMIKALLVERFKLAVHTEQRELPLFALVALPGTGRSAPGLRNTECPALDVDLSRPQRCVNISQGRGRLTLRGMPISQLLPFLAPAVNRTIVDRTALDGRYDIDLTWTPELSPTTPEGVSIFTALQEQLGLKLESTRGPVEVLVIDHAELPTEN